MLKRAIVMGLMLALGLAAAGARAQGGGGARIYTAYNIWFENPQGISSVNYKRGGIIPAGTPVTDVQITEDKNLFQYGRPVIRFTTDEGRTYTLFFHEEYHPGVDIETYKNRMFTRDNFEQLTAGFDKREIESIKQGVLRVGMSKDAVVVCWGYPPKVATPSLEANRWRYWTSRMHRKDIYFNAEGETIRPPDNDAPVAEPERTPRPTPEPTPDPDIL